ncbi:MAG: sensor histidine kinase [Caldilineaceae bacterium]
MQPEGDVELSKAGARTRARRQRMLEDRRVRWRTSLTYVAVILLLGVLLALSTIGLVRSAQARGIERLLRAEAGLTAGNPDLLAAWQDDPYSLGPLLERWGEVTEGRLTAISAQGVILADSEPSTDAGSSVATAEVRQALQTGYGRAIRRVGTAGEQTLFVALPVAADGSEPLGVLRWSVPLRAFDGELLRLQQQIAILVMGAALLLSALVLWERERSAGVLRRLTAMIEQALAQEFGGHVLTSNIGELGQLVGASNRLVDKYRKATKRRAREKDRLNTVLTHMSSGAMILNEYGSVRLINPAAAALLRTTEERAMRQSFVQVAWDHRVAEVWQRCVQSGAEESESIELGPDRFIRVLVTPFMGGDAGGYLVIMQDLTPQRRLEKMRRDFVSNVSHELRTPLASMGALVDTLRDGALEDPPAARRFLDRMDVEVDKMTQMVQELLELSRIESGQLPLRLNPSGVSQFVQPALDRLAMQAERGGVRLIANIPAGLPRVVADVERVQQVLINLVHNALKFTPKGGQIVVTAFATPGDEGTVTLCVRDTGVGIPLADQPRIFERFYKTDRSRSSGGTGLGLAIAKHTVQAHGGKIWVESTDGAGSTFYFTLPADNPQPGERVELPFASRAGKAPLTSAPTFAGTEAATPLAGEANDDGI